MEENKIFWWTKTECITIEDMSTAHIKNALKKLKRDNLGYTSSETKEVVTETERDFNEVMGYRTPFIGVFKRELKRRKNE